VTRLHLLQVDAALDATNLHRIANYMRRSTRDSCENAAQGIVISLKDVVYQKADALVGVTKNVHGNASSVFTMDLERFGPPQD
jgi:structural maintenance of chromosome 1